MVASQVALMAGKKETLRGVQTAYSSAADWVAWTAGYSEYAWVAHWVATMVAPTEISKGEMLDIWTVDMLGRSSEQHWVAVLAAAKVAW